jgi:hypothetical protein
MPLTDDAASDDPYLALNGEEEQRPAGWKTWFSDTSFYVVRVRSDFVCVLDYFQNLSPWQRM